VIADDLAHLLVPLDRLDTLPGNPRHGDVDAVVRSYSKFGQRKPIVARHRDGGRGEVTAGNTQLAAARQLGWDSIAVVWVDDDDVTAKAWALADNRTSDLGSYDEAALAAFLEEVQAMGDDELFAATAYREADLVQFQAHRDRGQADPDEVPEAAAGEPMTAPGDTWLLGRHRLVCGDSTDPDVVAGVLGGAEPYLMVTDPPYGVALDPRWRNQAGLNKIPPGTGEQPYMMSEGHGNRTMSGDTKVDWSEAFDLVPSLRVAYVWHGGVHAAAVLGGLERIGFHAVAQIIWDKGMFAIGRGMYHWGHEPCWVVRRGGPVPFLGPRDQSTVWRAASPKMIMSGSDEEKYDHPSQKPLAVIEPPLLNHLGALGTVYEPFSGSGTTLMAAQVHGRVCLAVELDPRYVDITCRRWQGYTGRPPVLERTGEPVDFSLPAPLTPARSR
jgi:DNA modification methylase